MNFLTSINLSCSVSAPNTAQICQAGAGLVGLVGLVRLGLKFRLNLWHFHHLNIDPMGKKSAGRTLSPRNHHTVPHLIFLKELVLTTNWDFYPIALCWFLHVVIPMIAMDYKRPSGRQGSIIPYENQTTTVTIAQSGVFGSLQGSEKVDPDWEDASRDSGQVNEKLLTNCKSASWSKRICQRNSENGSLFRESICTYIRVYACKIYACN